MVTRGNLSLSNIGRIGTMGDMLILISAVNWAVFSVLSRGMLKRLPSALMMFYVMLFGFGFSSLLFFVKTGVGDIAHLTLNGWTAVLILGILGSGLAYIAWYDALQNLTANQAGVFLEYRTAGHHADGIHCTGRADYLGFAAGRCGDHSWCVAGQP